MLDQIKQFFTAQEDASPQQPRVLDKKLAAAALMVHVIAADGEIKPEEDARLHAILEEHYAVSAAEADALTAEARARQAEAIDLYAFTSLLKQQMDESERLALVEDLWEMVYADGTVHEFEDNVVWRTAELLGILSRDRMVLKQRVLARREGA
ncbi:MAG: TerB family tellurite resistance protein [Pseudomonadota bacterium]